MNFERIELPVIDNELQNMKTMANLKKIDLKTKFYKKKKTFDINKQKAHHIHIAKKLRQKCANLKCKLVLKTKRRNNLNSPKWKLTINCFHLLI